MSNTAANRSGPTPIETEDPAQRPRRQTWMPARLLGACVLLAILALNGLVSWIAFTDAVDVDVALEAEPGLAVAVRFLGFEWTAISVGMALGGVVATTVIAHDRRNRIGWYVLGFVVPWVVATALANLSVASFGGALPGSWAPWLATLAGPAFLVFLTGGFVFLATFPTGRLQGGRWRRLALGALLAWGVAAIVRTFHPGAPIAPGGELLSFDSPIGIQAIGRIDPALLPITLVAVAATLLLLLGVRYRSSSNEVRQQIKWVVAGSTVLIGAGILVEVAEVPWDGYAVAFGLIVSMSSLGIAITKYRLYDIDLVINKALVFGALAAFVTAIYAVIVVGLGSVITDSSLALSVTATAIVAVVFEPVRVRVQKLANRLVYGSRATPYEVLSELTARLAEAERGEGLLERMAERLSEGTGAERAIVWLAGPDGLSAAATVPAEATPSALTRGEDLPGVTVVVEHEGDLLGALSVEKSRGEDLTPTERQLVEDLAGSAGLVLRRRRLDAALTQRAVELQESRRRLVNAQDVERRRLERQLNDSAQQQVVALKVKLGLARQLAASEGADRAETFIEQMADDAQHAIDQIRALAQGIYPPLLEAEGLAAAVPALSSSSPLETTTKIDVAGRHALHIEGAIYFCISEALTNATKHGKGPIAISVTHASDDRLSFSVTDSGPGFDPATVERGAGMDNLRDRLEALGGVATIASEPGAPTTVSGSVPASVLVA